MLRVVDPERERAVALAGELSDLGIVAVDDETADAGEISAAARQRSAISSSSP